MNDRAPFVQGLTDERLEERRMGIGGSDISAILGINPWKSPVDLYLEKIGMAPAVEQNDAMTWGIILEDPVARYYAHQENVKIQRINKMIEHPKNRIFRANVDRMIVNPGSIVRLTPSGLLGTKKGLEVKTASAYKAGEWGNEWDDDEVPDVYVAQCMWYMGVTGLDEWDIACLIGGQKYIKKTIARDDTVIDLMFDSAQKFWDNHVIREIPPEPRTSADVCKLFPSDNGKTVQANQKTLELLSRARELKEQIKALEIELDGDKKRGIGGIAGSIKAYIGEAAGVELDGRILATFKKTKDGAKTDWQALFDWASKSIIERDPSMAPIIDAAVADKTVITQGTRRFLIKGE